MQTCTGAVKQTQDINDVVVQLQHMLHKLMNVHLIGLLGNLRKRISNFLLHDARNKTAGGETGISGMTWMSCPVTSSIQLQRCQCMAMTLFAP